MATSEAICRPQFRTMRGSPPAAAYRPTVASGRPKDAFGEATTISLNPSAIDNTLEPARELPIQADLKSATESEAIHSGDNGFLPGPPAYAAEAGRGMSCC